MHTNSEEWLRRDHARYDYDDMPIGKQFDLIAAQTDALAKEAMDKAGIDPAQGKGLSDDGRVEVSDDCHN